MALLLTGGLDMLSSANETGDKAACVLGPRSPGSQPSNGYVLLCVVLLVAMLAGHSWALTFEQKAEGAIYWAQQQLGSHTWDWWCARFVANAYGADTAGGNAIDLWTQLDQHTTSWSSAPRGALLYWTYERWGHVGIYEGNGKVIHAFGDSGVVESSASSILPGKYLGWTHPRSSWPGRTPPGGAHPDPPVLHSPPHESHRFGRPILDWNNVPGATKYQVRIGDYYSPVVTGSSWRLDKDLTPKAGYWWRVKAGNGAGWSAWSQPFRLWLAPYTEVFEGDATTGDANHNKWGWHHVQDMATIHGPDGDSWAFTITGNDSQIVSPSGYFGRACHQVNIEIANHTQSQRCQLFWRRAGMSYFDQAHHVNVNTTVERSVAHATCYFHPDTIELRFDPVAGSPGTDPETGGDPYVEWYRIGFCRYVTWPDWPFDVDNNGKGWWSDDPDDFHSIDKSIFPHGGVWHLRIIGSNPYMRSPYLNLEGSDWAYLEVTMQNESDSSAARLSWRNSDGQWDAVDFTAPNDGVMRTYTVPISMAGHINLFRFDPTQGSSGDVYLKRIRLIPASSLTLDPIGDKQGAEGEPLEFVVSASSTSGGSLTLSASNLPDGATFIQDTATTGTFSWTPSFVQAGTYSGVHFEVTDGSTTVSEDITITIDNVNRPPVMDPVGDQSSAVGEELSFSVCASDADGDPLTFSASGLPSGATFAQTSATCATFTWTPGTVGAYSGITLSVQDDQGGIDSETITINVGEGTYELSLVADPPGSGSVKVNGLTHSLPWSGPMGGGTEVTLEAVPGTGVSFSEWTGSLTGTANPATVTMDGDKSITAHFIVGGRVLSAPEITAALSASAIQAPIALDDADGVAGIDFTLHFDPAVVQCQEAAAAEATAGFTLMSNIDNDAGTCSVSMMSLTALSAGPKDVVVLTFAPADGLTEESCTVLDLTDCYLSDDQGGSIPVRPEDGSICLTEVGNPCDVNGDGVVTSGDAILLLRAAVGLPAPDGWLGHWPPVSTNDVNCDGVINSADAIIVLRVAAGLQDCPSCVGSSIESPATRSSTPRVVTLQSASAATGQTAIMSLCVDDASDIAGADFEISFDPSVVQFAGAQCLALAEGFILVSNPDNTAGTVSISLASASGIDTGSGAFLELDFQVIGSSPQRSQIDAESAALYDEYGNPIECTASDGCIVVDFPDVESAHWAHDAVVECVAAGIVSGYGDGCYHPDWEVTRDQMAVYMARALAGGDENVPTGPVTASFDDMPTDHWAYKYVEYCYAEGIVQGYWDGYHPGEVVDRAQMAVYMARAVAGGDSSVPGGPETATFNDVPTDHWAYKYVEYCHAQGIVQGYDPVTYAPNVVVTRDQMAVYVARAFDLTM